MEAPRPATSSLDLRPAVEFPLTFLADAFAAGFQGYFVPVAADVRAFEARVRTEHIHLGDSYVALREGRAAAIVLTSRRGSRSRMAGLGVVPELRGSGLGRVLTDRLIAEARARGDRELVLECIESNAAALALYLGRGFVVQRRLVGWERPPPPALEGSPRGADSEWTSELREVPLAEAVTALFQHGEPGLPWQLAPETVAGLTLPSRAYRLDDAWAVVVDASPEVRLLRAIVVPRSQRRRGLGRRLLRALFAANPGASWRVSAIVPETLGAEFFPAMGFGRAALSQLELVHPLKSP